MKCVSSSHINQLYPYGSKEPLKTAGCYTAKVAVEDVAVEAEFNVIEGKGQALLGRETATQLKVLSLSPNLCVNSSEEKNIFQKYKSCFEGLEKLKDFQLNIPIDPCVKPVVQSMRRVPFSLRDKLEKKLNELVDLDVIEKAKGTNPWISPVVVVPKPNGDLRLCVDMRQANGAIVRQRHPILTVDEILHDLNGSTVFTKLDIKWAFHQVELSEESRPITTFVTHKGLFRYKRLMFGISCAPEMYQRVMQQALEGCEGVRNIHDDIIVHGKTAEQYDARLDKALERIQEKGLTLNKEKCKFHMSEIEFMGHLLSAGGIGPTQAKVEDITEARKPESVAEVRSFLGLVNFCARFIPDLATVSAFKETHKKRHTLSVG